MVCLPRCAWAQSYGAVEAHTWQIILDGPLKWHSWLFTQKIEDHQAEADPEKNDQVGQSNIRGTYVWVGAPWREAAILPQEEIQGPMALGSL